MTFSMILLYVTKFSPAHYDGTVSSSSVRGQTNENEPHSELNMMHHASNSTAAGGIRSYLSLYVLNIQIVKRLDVEDWSEKQKGWNELVFGRNHYCNH